MSNVEDNGIRSSIRQQAKRQRFHARLIRFLIIGFFIISFLTLPFWALYLLVGGIGPGLFSEVPPYIPYIIFLLVYGTFFVIPFLLCLPVVLPLAIKQKNVSRIIVFRKFNNEESKKALSRIIRSGLANYGHVFTLSDSKFKVKWYVRIPVFMGQLSLFNFRQRNITRETQIPAFRRKLSNYTWLNINWLLSRSKIFPVKTSDEHWKKTAQILLQRNNLIIFDVSYASESLEWEIMQTRELGYEKNVIALASLSNKEEAIQWKLKYDFPDEHDIPIFFYDAQGNLEDDAGFSDTVVNKLSLTYEEGVRGLDMSRRYGLGQAFLTAGLALLFFLISLFFMGPYLLPQFVAMHTPFASQAVKAYIQTKIQDDNMGSSISQRNILNRIRRKWPHKSAGIIYDHALDHHKTECVAIQAILTELTDPEHIADYALLVLNGEPKISEAAFQIIESLNPNGNYGIAVKLLHGKRIYVKDKGSRLLQKTNLNSVLARQLLASLDHAPLETEPEPYQHFATGLFVSHKSYSEKLNAKLEETEFQTNFRLYRTLAPFIDSTSLPILHKLLDPNKPAGLRFLAALLKAGLNDAQGIGLLSNASFIEEDQNLMEQVFSVDPRYPYRPVIDSLIRSFSRQSVLPPISTILSDINAVRPGNNNAGFPASAKLLDIVIRFYSDEEFQQFLKGMINSESEELIEVFNDAWLKKEIPAERLIKLTEIARPRILPAISVGVPMSLRLKAAWILAHLGDTAVAATAIEAGQIRNFLNFLTYRDEAESILNTLLIHLKNTADPTPLRSLKPLKDSQQEVLINQILRKLGSIKP